MQEAINSEIKGPAQINATFEVKRKKSPTTSHQQRAPPIPIPM